MNLKIGNKIGKVSKKDAKVKPYRSAPADRTLACFAGVYYAQRDNQRMVIVPGNSYGRFVYRIDRDTADIKSHQPGKSEVNVFVAYPNGELFHAVAS